MGSFEILGQRRERYHPYPAGTAVVGRWQADVLLEMSVQVALVEESAFRGHLGDRLSAAQKMLRQLNAQLYLIRMRGHPDLTIELLDQLQAAALCDFGELLQRDIVAEMCL